MAASDSTPIAAGDQTVWTNCTDFISTVCQALDFGELIHAENFSLFEAMAALEIMDPKMDAGMDFGGPKSLQEAVDMGLAPLDLSTAQVIDIMDQLLASEATWHRGHSLAQTVYSSLYMLDINRTFPLPVLHAFCRITEATCSVIRAGVAKSHTHEEEDIFVAAFGLPVLDYRRNDDCIDFLDIVEKMLKKQQLEQAFDNAESDSVSCRLRFRKAFYQAFVCMDASQPKDLRMARKHISTALEELSSIRASCVSVSCDGPSTASGRKALGFEENLTRSLLPPAPPRTMKLLTWNEALDYFERLLRDLDRVCSVPQDVDLEAILQLVVDFQKSRPDLVARSRMQLLLLQSNKLFGTKAMDEVVHTAIYPHNEQPRNPLYKGLYDQAGWLIVHLLKVVCANCAWQCRKLGKTLEEWSNLIQQLEIQHEESMAKTFTDGPIVAWIAWQTSWIAMQHLMLGFELELYSFNEYCMIYWYLDHVLLTLMHYKSERLKQSAAGSKAPASTEKRKGKGRIKGRMSPVQQVYHPDLMYLSCLSDLCKAYIWMLIALTRDGKIAMRQSNFTTDLETFMQRFELLHKTMIPTPLSFGHYLEATKVNFGVLELYRLSLDYFRAVHRRLPNLAKAHGSSEMSSTRTSGEIRQLEQVVLRNQVALSIILKTGAGFSLKVKLQFLHHPCFGDLSVTS